MQPHSESGEAKSTTEPMPVQTRPSIHPRISIHSPKEILIIASRHVKSDFMGNISVALIRVFTQLVSANKEFFFLLESREGD